MLSSPQKRLVAETVPGPEEMAVGARGGDEEEGPEEKKEAGSLRVWQ